MATVAEGKTVPNAPAGVMTRNLVIKDYLDKFSRPDWPMVLECTLLYGIRALYSTYPPGSIGSLEDLDTITAPARRDLQSISPTRKRPLVGHKSTAPACTITSRQPTISPNKALLDSPRRCRKDALFHYPFVDETGSVDQILTGPHWSFFDLDVREQMRQAKKVYEELKGSVHGISLRDLPYALRYVGVGLTDYQVTRILPHLYARTDDGEVIPPAKDVWVTQRQWLDILRTLQDVLQPMHHRRTKHNEAQEGAGDRLAVGAGRAGQRDRRTRSPDAHTRTAAHRASRSPPTRRYRSASPSSRPHPHRRLLGPRQPPDDTSMDVAPPSSAFMPRPSSSSSVSSAPDVAVRRRSPSPRRGPSPSRGLRPGGRKERPRSAGANEHRNAGDDAGRVKAQQKQPPTSGKQQRQHRGGGAAARGFIQGDGDRGGHGVPHYLRNVQSRIKPELDARRSFQRKVKAAKESALLEALAQRRLKKRDPHYESYKDRLGCADKGSSRENADAKASAAAARLRSGVFGRGATSREIADAFLESPLMEQLSEASSAKIGGAARAEAKAGQHDEDQKEVSGHISSLDVKRNVKGPRDEDGGRQRRWYTDWLGEYGPSHTHVLHHGASLDGQSIGEEGAPGRNVTASRRSEGVQDEDGLGGNDERTPEATGDADSDVSIGIPSGITTPTSLSGILTSHEARARDSDYLQYLSSDNSP